MIMSLTESHIPPVPGEPNRPIFQAC